MSNNNNGKYKQSHSVNDYKQCVDVVSINVRKVIKYLLCYKMESFWSITSCDQNRLSKTILFPFFLPTHSHFGDLLQLSPLKADSFWIIPPFVKILIWSNVTPCMKWQQQKGWRMWTFDWQWMHSERGFHCLT